MLSKKELEKIKEITKEFFDKTTLEVEIEISPPKETSSSPEEKAEKIYTLSINITAQEPQILIGERGQTLLDIQQLLNAILKKSIKENFFIDLDINDYKKRKIEYLKELARTVADEVSLAKKEKWLAAMPAYERRIIHLELSGRSDVTTESVGQEPERKIVIRPFP